MSRGKATAARRWGWAILLSTGGISLTFNIAHAIHAAEVGKVHAFLAVLYGVAPVLVALMLSHLMGIQQGGRFKRFITTMVFVAAMGLSVSAIAAVLQPIAGDAGYVFAVMLDVASLMGLNEILTSGSKTQAARTGQDRTVPDRTGQDRTAADAAEPDRTEEGDTVRSRTDEPPAAPAPETDPYVRPSRTEEIRTTDPHPYGPYGSDEEPRTDPYGQPEETRTAQVSHLIPRADFVQQLAEEIRTAQAADRTWRPDYDLLIKRTGYGRSWCEKAVRDARTAAAKRTDTEPVQEETYG